MRYHFHGIRVISFINRLLWTDNRKSSICLSEGMRLKFRRGISGWFQVDLISYQYLILPEGHKFRKCCWYNENCSIKRHFEKSHVYSDVISDILVKILDNQPVVAPSSSIKKCCPLHQHYKYDYGKRSCANSTERFEVSAIKARFYENCIEDEEMNVTISVVVENNCKK